MNSKKGHSMNKTHLICAAAALVVVGIYSVPALAIGTAICSMPSKPTSTVVSQDGLDPDQLQAQAAQACKNAGIKPCNISINQFDQDPSSYDSAVVYQFYCGSYNTMNILPQ
jgi:hypothetical protein